MADNSDKREHRVKLDNTGSSKADIKGIDVDPGKEIKTRKTADMAKQDMEFGEAMEADMDRYSRAMAGGRDADENWKDRPRHDGNKNLETSNDLTFIDKMYTPVIRSLDNPERGDMDSKTNEFAEDNAYLRDNKDKRTIEEKRNRGKDDNNGK